VLKGEDLVAVIGQGAVLAGEPGDQGLQGGDAEEAAWQAVVFAAAVLVVGCRRRLGAVSGGVVSIGFTGHD